jgi:hypothetical protein
MITQHHVFWKEFFADDLQPSGRAANCRFTAAQAVQLKQGVDSRLVNTW